MSNKPKTETTTQHTDSTSTPLAQQQPLFTDIWNKAGSAAVNTPTQWVASVNPMQTGAVDMMAGVAPTLGANAGNLRDMAAKVSNGFFLDPSNDPTFAGAAKAAINPITRTLREQILPGITDASIRNGGVGTGPGAYGGARQDIQENKAVQDWTQTAGDITSKMANVSRNAGLDLIKLGPALDSGATAAALSPSAVLGAAGTQRQALDQSGIDNIIKGWMGQLTGAQQGANILTTGGFGNKSSDTTGTKTGPAPDMATQWLQGITGGAGALNSLYNLPGVASGISGIGGWLSGLGGAGAAGAAGMGTAAETASLLASLGPLAMV